MMYQLFRSVLSSSSKILSLNPVRQIHIKNITLNAPVTHVPKSLNRNVNPILICIRKASEKRTMEVIPSHANNWETLDSVHFYVMLGLIPSLMIVFFVNTFIGQAELTDIPEGYEPRHWEYHKHPICRFIAKYMTENPQKIYETRLGNILDCIKRKEVVDEAHWFRQSQRAEGDFRGWYFIPVNPSGVNRALRQYEQDQEEGRILSR